MKNTINSAPHRRYNILTREWILVSPKRTKRPWQGKTEKSSEERKESYIPSFYLCLGNTRSSGEKKPDYKDSYVFENNLPALLPNAPVKTVDNGLLKAESEAGICKVVCFSPDHYLTLPIMEVKDIVKVIKTWKKEYEELGAKYFINYVQIFENKGAIMGMGFSKPHPNGQIWSQSSIPTEILKKTEHFKDYWQLNSRSLLQDYLEQELKLDEHILIENEHLVALVPYWAVWSYEAMILPKKHHQYIGQLSSEEEKAFVEIIKKMCIKFDNLFETSFPYSSGIHQQPTDGKEHPEWHFHMSFYPPLLRSKSMKKFMVGYEMFANPQRDITAEQAAETLRNLPEVHYLSN